MHAISDLDKGVCPDCGGECGSILHALERLVVAERRIGKQVIAAGERVRIAGLPRGCVPELGPKGPVLKPGFRVIGFKGPDVIVFGRKGPKRVDHVRTFTVERIGTRT